MAEGQRRQKNRPRQGPKAKNMWFLVLEKYGYRAAASRPNRVFHHPNENHSHEMHQTDDNVPTQIRGGKISIQYQRGLG